MSIYRLRLVANFLPCLGGPHFQFRELLLTVSPDTALDPHVLQPLVVDTFCWSDLLSVPSQSHVCSWAHLRSPLLVLSSVSNHTLNCFLGELLTCILLQAVSDSNDKTFSLEHFLESRHLTSVFTGSYRNSCVQLKDTHTPKNTFSITV